MEKRNILKCESFIAPFPDELIESAVRRSAEIFYYKERRSSSYLWFRRYDELRRSPTLDEYGEAINMDVALNFTLYPLYSALGISREFLLYVPRGGWKICYRCVLHDIDAFGVAYIHREWVVRSNKVCDKHCIDLVELCPSCGCRILWHSLHAFYSCSKSFAQTEKVSQVSQVSLVEYATYLRGLISLPPELRSLERVSAAIYIALLRHGYGLNKGLNSSALDLSQVYRDCNSILKGAVKFYEWHHGIVDPDSFVFLSYQAFGRSDELVRYCEDDSIFEEFISLDLQFLGAGQKNHWS